MSSSNESSESANSNIRKPRFIDMKTGNDEKHTKFSIPETSPRHTHFENASDDKPSNNDGSGVTGKHASFGEELPSFKHERRSSNNRLSENNNTRTNSIYSDKSGTNKSLRGSMSSSRKNSIYDKNHHGVDNLDDNNKMKSSHDDIAEYLLLEQRSRPLCVGDLVMINCSTGSLSGCLVSNDHNGGKFGDMNIKLQASKHHVYNEHGDIINSIIGGNDSSSQNTSLMIFEIYRCSSAEDLNRASMNRNAQGHLNKDFVSMSGGGGQGGNTTSTMKGTPILFNQALQLRHYHSRKLLVIDIHAKSTTDPLSMEVLLQNEYCQNDDELSRLTHAETISNSWFTIESANTALDLGEVLYEDTPPLLPPPPPTSTFFTYHPPFLLQSHILVFCYMNIVFFLFYFINI